MNGLGRDPGQPQHLRVRLHPCCGEISKINSTEEPKKPATFVSLADCHEAEVSRRASRKAGSVFGYLFAFACFTRLGGAYPMTYAAKLGLEIFTLPDSLFSRPGCQLRKLDRRNFDFRPTAGRWTARFAFHVRVSSAAESNSADFSSSAKFPR